MELLERIPMGASEKDVKTAFSGWTALPPHPSKTAIGFIGLESGQPVAVIAYFAKSLFSSHLSRAVINFFPERAPDDQIALKYEKVAAELTLRFGQPVSDEAESVLSALQDYRMSRMTIWAADSRVLTLGMALVRDGVRTTHPGLALSVADPKRDPEARLVAERLHLL